MRRVPRRRDPGHVRQVAAVGVLHPRVAAQFLELHGRARARRAAVARHHVLTDFPEAEAAVEQQRRVARSEEHTSELQSLMRISYAVFCLKKKNITELTLIYTTQRRSHMYYYYKRSITTI